MAERKLSRVSSERAANLQDKQASISAKLPFLPPAPGANLLSKYNTHEGTEAENHHLNDLMYRGLYVSALSVPFF